MPGDVDISEFTAEVKLSPAPAGSNKVRDQIIPELTPKQQKSLLTAALDPTITNTAIRRVLGRWGHRVSEGTVRKWRIEHKESVSDA